MGKARIATGVLLVTVVTGAMGYTIASAVLTYQDLGFGAEIDFAYIAQNYLAILDRRPEDAQLIHLIIGSFAAAGLMLSLALSGSALTRFGQTHWQTAREMKANGFFGAPGTGFTQRGWKGVARSCPKHISSTTTSSSLSRLMSSFVIKERARRMIYRSHSLS